jgi:hypothetical protein
MTNILTQLAPFIIIVVIVILISRPLNARIFDRTSPLNYQLIKKRQRYKEEVANKRASLDRTIKETGACPSKEQSDQVETEIKVLSKDLMSHTLDTAKEIMRVTNEESGLFFSVENSTAFYVASMLATPIPAPIVLGLSGRYFPTTSGGNSCLLLLPLPVAGAWLAYKGYKLLQKRTALVLCLAMNGLYAALLIFGAILMR